MNKSQREKLQELINTISEVRETIEGIRDEEQEKFDNLSEGLQQSEKGQKFENAVSTLEEALDSTYNIVDCLEIVIG